MSSTWTIRANDRVFGPYTLEQMRSFAGQGRLAPNSQVAQGHNNLFRSAGDYPDLASLFAPAQPVVPQPAAPQPIQTTSPQPGLQRPVFFTADGDIGQTFNRRETEVATQSRFLILADMKSRSIAGLEEEIFRCGQAVALMPQAWLLASDMTINALRNLLIQKLGRIDMLFIVDAARNKAAWFNYGPEADSRIRRVWQEAQKQAAE